MKLFSVCLCRICSLEVLKSKTVDSMNLNNSVIDLCGDYFNACLPSLMKLLCKALGERVKLVAVKPTASPSVRQHKILVEFSREYL